MGLFLHGVRFFIFSPVFPAENGSFNIFSFQKRAVEGISVFLADKRFSFPLPEKAA